MPAHFRPGGVGVTSAKQTEGVVAMAHDADDDPDDMDIDGDDAAVSMDWDE